MQQCRLGRKPTLTHHQRQEAIKRRDAGKETLGEIARSLQCEPLDDFKAAFMNETHRFGFLRAAGLGSEGRTNPRIRRYELTVLSQQKRFYHYTNLAGLKGIVESNGMWANHVAYMNDAEEVCHGRRLASEVLTRLAERRYHNGFQSVVKKVVEQFRPMTLEVGHMRSLGKTPAISQPTPRECNSASCPR